MDFIFVNKGDFMTNFKKGATLIELTIVMAILTIVTVMTVTFSQLIRNQVLSITTENNIIEDWENTRHVFDTFIYSYDNSDYDFYCENDSLYAVNKNNGKKSVLTLSNDIFVGEIPNDVNNQGKVIYSGTRSIESVRFSITDNQETHKLLIKMEIKYKGYNVAGTKEVEDKFTFLKSTKVSGLYE